MKIWLAHKTLADAVGDNADIDSTDLYDGVRYSKAERDGYLYQALIRVFNKLIQPIKTLSRKQMLSVVDRYFPNMKQTYDMEIVLSDDYQIYSEDLIGAGYFNPAIIMDMYVTYRGANDKKMRGFPIPFKTTDQVAELINSRNAFQPDLFFTYEKNQHLTNGSFKIHDYQQEIRDLSLLGPVVTKVTALNYPQNPEGQLPTDELDIEEAYVDWVMSTAIVLMMRDDQEVEGVERVMPLIEPFTQGGQ